MCQEVANITIPRAAEWARHSEPSWRRAHDIARAHAENTVSDVYHAIKGAQHHRDQRQELHDGARSQLDRSNLSQ
jgi:hypothetical protein